MNNPVASTASKPEAPTKPNHGSEQSAAAVSPNMHTTAIKAMAEHLVRNVAAAETHVAISAQALSARRITLEAERANRIYIAGPMTGLPDLNFPAFHDQAEQLRDLGWHVENPAEHGVVENAEWGDYLRYDIGRLASCEAVWLLPGWSTSKGAQLELHIALALGMTVIGSLGDQANKGARSEAIPAPAKATLLAPTGLEELAQKWENRSREAAPTDAMVINLHIRELRETLAPTQIAAGAGLITWPTMPPNKGQSSVMFDAGYDEGWARCMSDCKKAAALSAPQGGPAVGRVDEDDDGLFVEILQGPDGSSLKLGDMLYAGPQSEVAQQAPAAPVAQPGAADAELTDEQAHQLLLDMAQHAEGVCDDKTTDAQMSAAAVRFIVEQHALRASQAQVPATAIAGLEKENQILKAENESLRSTCDRMRDALGQVAQQAPAAVAAPLEFTAQHVEYISRYGGKCRDCADENGTCPSSGLTCADQVKAIYYVLKALAYGVNNGFLPHPAAIAAQEGGPK